MKEARISSQTKSKESSIPKKSVKKYHLERCLLRKRASMKKLIVPKQNKKVNISEINC